jgi:hypothetical protein
MDRIFVEQELNNTLRIAVVDRYRIFNAQNPGQLATVFECSLSDPTDSDRAELYFAMAPSIGADKIFSDIKDTYRSAKLNVWSIAVKDSSTENIFSAVAPLSREDRLSIYSTKHSITPDDSITSTSKSLFSLLAFGEKQSWKTGLLQRCINCLVYPKFFNNPQVQSVIDEEYRRIMRFKYETETTGIPPIQDGVLVDFIRRITSLLELKHSRDTTVFSSIPSSISQYLDFFVRVIPSFNKYDSLQEGLSLVLSIWSGSQVVKCDNCYKLELNATVTEALSYMIPLPVKPEKLALLDTPM